MGRKIEHEFTLKGGRYGVEKKGKKTAGKCAE